MESPRKEALFKFTATLDKNDHVSLKDAIEKNSGSGLKCDPRLLKRIINKKDAAAKKANETKNAASIEKRYKLLSDLRGLQQNEIESEISEETERLFKLVDVVKDDNVDFKEAKKDEDLDQITCNGVPLVKLAQEEYVYDVYTMASPDTFSSTDSAEPDFADFDVTDIVDIR